MTVTPTSNSSRSTKRVLPTTRQLGVSLVFAVVLGAATSLLAVAALARLCDPPDGPPSIVRTFVRDGRAWSVVESHGPGIIRAWWASITRDQLSSSITANADPRLAAGDDPAQLVADYRLMYGDIVRTHPGRRMLEGAASWGQFTLHGPPPSNGEIGCDVGFGWPWACAWYQVRGRSRGRVAFTDDLRFGYQVAGVPAARGDLRCRVIPFAPAWWNLAGNTAVLAAPWLLALLLPGIVRRRLRKSRGRCARCGYDLKATPSGSRCPECGAT